MSFRRRKGLGGESSEDGGGRGGGRPAAGGGGSAGGGPLATASPALRRWGGAAAVVLATGLAGYLVAAHFLFPGPSAAEAGSLVTVPDVRGTSLEDARARLEEADLNLAVAARLPVPDADRDEILAHRPAGGQRASPGDTVAVTVAAGEGRLPVPAVRGLRAGQALGVLRRMGFRVDTVRESSAVPEGEVVRTVPAAGEPAAPGTQVRLVLSQGPPVSGVPELVGRHVDDVASILADSGLALGAVGYDSAAASAPGRVVGQSPPSGFALREGERVSVRVAGSPPDTLAAPGGGG